jgi:hypothetical protein
MLEEENSGPCMSTPGMPVKVTGVYTCEFDYFCSLISLLFLSINKTPLVIKAAQGGEMTFFA